MAQHDRFTISAADHGVDHITQCEFHLGVGGYRKYKPPFCSSSEVSYLKFPHSFTAQAPILTAGPA
ncbi:hypothetical protein EI035_22055 [Escherichia coli]|nr:hypothetical protein [Escherichia coli]